MPYPLRISFDTTTKHRKAVTFLTLTTMVPGSWDSLLGEPLMPSNAIWRFSIHGTLLPFCPRNPSPSIRRTSLLLCHLKSQGKTSLKPRRMKRNLPHFTSRTVILHLGPMLHASGQVIQYPLQYSAPGIGKKL